MMLCLDDDLRAAANSGGVGYPTWLTPSRIPGWSLCGDGGVLFQRHSIKRLILTPMLYFASKFG
ncbi:hypothetical protein N9053_00970 [bacterium]|nr:hypothetical protein [bacterium]